MSGEDANYFLRRAAEEIAAADQATSAEAARAHFELANRYLRKIDDRPQTASSEIAERPSA